MELGSKQHLSLEKLGNGSAKYRKMQKGPVEEDSRGPRSACLVGSVWMEGCHGAADCY